MEIVERMKEMTEESTEQAKKRIAEYQAEIREEYYQEMLDSYNNPKEKLNALEMTRDEWIEHIGQGEHCDSEVISVVATMHSLRSEVERLRLKNKKRFDMIREIRDVVSEDMAIETDCVNAVNKIREIVFMYTKEPKAYIATDPLNFED